MVWCSKPLLNHYHNLWFLTHFSPKPPTPCHRWGWEYQTWRRICICLWRSPTRPPPPPRWSPPRPWTWTGSSSPSPGRMLRPAKVKWRYFQLCAMKSETNLYLIRVVLPPDLFVQGNHRHQLGNVLCQHSAKDSDIITHHTSSSLSLSSCTPLTCLLSPAASCPWCGTLWSRGWRAAPASSRCRGSRQGWSGVLSAAESTCTYIKFGDLHTSMPGYQSKLALTGRLDSLLTLSSSRPFQTLRACLFLDWRWCRHEPRQNIYQTSYLDLTT